MNRKTFDLTLSSLLLAIIILMAAIPSLGFISLPFLPVSITILHIPVIIGGVFVSRRTSLYLGLLFGLSSFVVAITRVPDITAPLFANPLVSVLPRMILGLVLIDILKFTDKVFKFDKRRIVSITVYFVLATLLHALMVLAAVFLAAKTGFYPDLLGNKADLQAIIVEGTNIAKFIYGVIISNSLFEAAAAVVIGLPIVKVLLVTTKR